MPGNDGYPHDGAGEVAHRPNNSALADTSSTEYDRRIATLSGQLLVAAADWKFLAHSSARDNQPAVSPATLPSHTFDEKEQRIVDHMMGRPAEPATGRLLTWISAGRPQLPYDETASRVTFEGFRDKVQRNRELNRKIFLWGSRTMLRDYVFLPEVPESLTVVSRSELIHSEPVSYKPIEQDLLARLRSEGSLLPRSEILGWIREEIGPEKPTAADGVWRRFLKKARLDPLLYDDLMVDDTTTDPHFGFAPEETIAELTIATDPANPDYAVMRSLADYTLQGQRPDRRHETSWKTLFSNRQWKVVEYYLAHKDQPIVPSTVLDAMASLHGGSRRAVEGFVQRTIARVNKMQEAPVRIAHAQGAGSVHHHYVIDKGSPADEEERNKRARWQLIVDYMKARPGQLVPRSEVRAILGPLELNSANRIINQAVRELRTGKADPGSSHRLFNRGRSNQYLQLTEVSPEEAAAERWSQVRLEETINFILSHEVGEVVSWRDIGKRLGDINEKTQDKIIREAIREIEGNAEIPTRTQRIRKQSYYYLRIMKKPEL